MELIIQADIFGEERMGDVMKEADELTAILTTCVKNAKRKA